MRILHGTWIPDGFFVFMAENQQVLPTDAWKHGIFHPAIGSRVEQVREQNCPFRMPEFIPRRSRAPQQPHHPAELQRLPTQSVAGVLVPIPHMFSFLLFQGFETCGTEKSRSGDGLPLTGEPVRISNDFVFWRRVTLFAMELLIRGRITPTVQSAPALTRGQLYGYSVWVPLVKDEHDLNRFQQFVGAMPPFCRSYDPDQKPGWLDVPPTDILLSFLTWGMDAWVRGAITERHRRVLQQAFDGESMSAGHASLAKTWVHGLLTPEQPVPFQSRKRDVETLAREVGIWTGRLVRSATTDTPGREPGTLSPDETPFRQGNLQLCLRLDTTEADDWSLQFLLRSVDDPSLLISAEEVWQTRSAHKDVQGWRFTGVQETLLAELGRAIRLYPALEQTLNEPRPTRLRMNVDMAHHFLREIVEIMEAAGFALLLPAWWTAKGRKRLGMKMRVQSAESVSWDESGISHVGLRQLVQFDMCAAIGDEELTLRELEELADLKAPLVRVRGMWTEVNPTELVQMINYLEAGGQGTIELGDLIHMAVGRDTDTTAGEKELGLPESGPVVDFDLPDGLRAFMDGRIDVPEKEVPSTLVGQLRPYQRRGFQWLSTMTRLGFGVCLADDMGLGKTVQVITLLLDMHGALSPTQLANRHPALVLCPTSLLGNWQRECERFAPSLRVYVQHGANRPHGLEFKAQAMRADVVVSTYHLGYRDFDDLSSLRWSYLILDEAQNIKNRSSKQARSIFRLQAQARIAMTGTPIENRLDELWSLFHFLNTGYLGNAEKFRTRFALPIERDRNPDRVSVLHELVAPFILRRVKTDPTIIQDLPEKIEMKTYCPLTREQASLYEAAVKNMLRELETAVGIERRGIILAGLTKLKQICNHPAHFLRDRSPLRGRSGKLVRLLELLTQIREAGEAVLVFTQYTEMGELLVQSMLQELGENALFLHGGISRRGRDHLVHLFQSDTGPGILVLSLKAGGVGLNLTRANHVIHFDRWWNPAVENQATDRAFRIGQKRNVAVHKFICQGTLEDNIDTLIESKRTLADQIVGTGETWLSEMSNTEIASLLTLRNDAIEEDAG